MGVTKTELLKKRQELLPFLHLIRSKGYAEIEAPGTQSPAVSHNGIFVPAAPVNSREFKSKRNFSSLDVLPKKSVPPIIDLHDSPPFEFLLDLLKPLQNCDPTPPLLFAKGTLDRYFALNK